MILFISYPDALFKLRSLVHKYLFQTLPFALGVIYLCMLNTYFESFHSPLFEVKIMNFKVNDQSFLRFLYFCILGLYFLKQLSLKKYRKTYKY